MTPDLKLPRVLHADSAELKELDWRPYERRSGVLLAVRMPYAARIPTIGDRPNLNAREGDYLVIGTDKLPYIVEASEWEKLYKPI